MYPLTTTTTHRNYLETYHRLWRETHSRAVGHRGEWTDVTAQDLVETWALRLKNREQYAPNTLRKYRAALVACLPQMQPPGWQAALAAIESGAVGQSADGAADEAIVFTGPIHRRRQSRRMIPEEDFRPLIAALEARLVRDDDESEDEQSAGGVWRRRAALALKAGVAAGCRPIEWLSADWIDRPAGILRIYSAKQKQRAQGWQAVPPLTFLDADDELGQLEDRIRWKEIDAQVRDNAFVRQVLFLKAIGLADPLVDEVMASKRWDSGVLLFRDVVIDSDMQLDVDAQLTEVKTYMKRKLERALKRGQSMDPSEMEDFWSKKYFNALRSAIWRVCRKVFTDGRLYSLADTRSTFAANRKALSGLKATAMAMGHVWPETTRDFYAPARRAWTKYAHANERLGELVQQTRSQAAEITMMRSIAHHLASVKHSPSAADAGKS
jgi:hypothetical protein